MQSVEQCVGHAENLQPFAKEPGTNNGSIMVVPSLSPSPSLSTNTMGQVGLVESTGLLESGAWIHLWDEATHIYPTTLLAKIYL